MSKFKCNIGIKSCCDQLSFDQKLLKNSTNNQKMGYILKPSEPITTWQHSHQVSKLYLYSFLFKIVGLIRVFLCVFTKTQGKKNSSRPKNSRPILLKRNFPVLFMAFFWKTQFSGAFQSKVLKNSIFRCCFDPIL